LIDPRAIIHPTAELGENVEIGPWTSIGANVEIGDNTTIASHVIVKGPTTIGKNNRIFQFTSIGEDTPDLSYQGEPTTLTIGDNNVIREGVTIHRGTVQDTGTTTIGSHGLFMAYVHIAHDCVIGDHVIMANNSAVSGHVKVGDYANFGGYSGVPQFRSIGESTHIAGMSLVLKDVPAFMTVIGNPAVAAGLNLEGLKRRNFSDEDLAAIKDAYRTVYRRGLTVAEALAELKPIAGKSVAVCRFLDSVESSRWGIVRPRGK